MMAGNIIELTDATFDKAVHDADMPVLVDFWAPWCGPCKMMVTVLEELAGTYVEKAKFCKINTDDARDSALEFGVTSIPTLILLKNGQMQKKWAGMTDKKEIAAAIDELL